MRADVAITRERSPLLAVLLASLVLHALLAPLVARWIAAQTAEFGPPVTVKMIDGNALDALTPEQAERLLALEAILPTPADPAATPEEQAPPDEPEPVVMPRGQVVEIPRPQQERVPVVAEYLAEFDSSVPVETRTDRVKVNPDVVSNRYSEESRLALEDVVDVGATEMSTGATPGSLALPTPGMGAPRSAVASPWPYPPVHATRNWRVRRRTTCSVRSAGTPWPSIRGSSSARPTSTASSAR
jgi:outer membrane biosynthesis protein TonB